MSCEEVFCDNYYEGLEKGKEAAIKEVNKEFDKLIAEVKGSFAGFELIVQGIRDRVVKAAENA